MATKVPGFFYTSYRQIQFAGPNLLINENQYMKLLQVARDSSEAINERYEQIQADYQFVNGVPKDRLYVRLVSGISAPNREEVGNGIRSYFKDDITFMLDRQQSLDAIQTSLMLFQIFVTIVGIIALTIAFFLLLISTTANIRENSWEFGVLRSMGVTKQMAYRIFMYEAFAVMLSALILGILIGLTVAFTLTAQFYLFIELPFKLSVIFFLYLCFQFPTVLFCTMVVMSLLTTFFAVFIPVRKINQKKIAGVLKGQ